jgi:hypothetical protein
MWWMQAPVVAAIPWDVAVPTASGVLATLLGVLVGGVVTSRAQRRHWQLTSQVEACAGILRECAKIYHELAQANHERRRGRLGLDWPPWNQALAVANLVTDNQIVAAAHRLDAAIWVMSIQIARGELDDEDAWTGAVNRVEAAHLDFVNTARSQLARPGPSLGQLWGKPDPSDPIWQA